MEFYGSGSLKRTPSNSQPELHKSTTENVKVFILMFIVCSVCSTVNESIFIYTDHDEYYMFRHTNHTIHLFVPFICDMLNGKIHKYLGNALKRHHYYTLWEFAEDLQRSNDFYRSCSVVDIRWQDRCSNAIAYRIGSLEFHYFFSGSSLIKSWYGLKILLILNCSSII